MTVPRPEHKPIGDPCEKCGLAAARHRNRGQVRAAYIKAWHDAHKSGERHILALDGEGYNDESGNHRYTYMAAATSVKLVGEIENVNGLRTVEVLDFLLSLPVTMLKTGFSLGYDITKWLEDLPNGALYYLNHPEHRQGKKGPRAIHWRQYWINRVSSRFSVRVDDTNCVVWDLFKFFGKAFVLALKDWKIGKEYEISAIQDMKDKRGSFKGISEKEKQYCRDECRFMAEMADKLLTAHVDAGLPLKSYYGPGSTASVMLEQMGAKGQIATFPTEMQEAVDSAYAGGRFEHSCVGHVYEVPKFGGGALIAHGRDIASAYPYAMSQLPCLEHGTWERVTQKKGLFNKIERAPAACVRYELPSYDELDTIPLTMRQEDLINEKVMAKGQPALVAWGPFPYRCPDGNIIFPVVSPGGWIWQQEFLTACRHYPNVEPIEAWILKQSCSCGHPFDAKVAHFYNLRLEWGKEGKGIVVKLGVNSCYGKRAQRAGSGPFRCFVSAGMITSYTRAMLLEAIFKASDPWNVSSLATDGIVSSEALDLDEPVLTGTEDQARYHKKASLGSWEEKPIKGGVHLIRPGIRFPLDFLEEEKEQMKNVAARGLGTKVLFKNRIAMLEAWQKHPMADVRIQQPDMFIGMKSAITKHSDGSYERSELYGKWETPEPRKVSYMSLPKRPTCLGKSNHYRLTTWALSPDMGLSRPYSRTPQSELARHAADMKTLEWEQPDQGKLFSY